MVAVDAEGRSAFTPQGRATKGPERKRKGKSLARGRRKATGLPSRPGRRNSDAHLAIFPAAPVGTEGKNAKEPKKPVKDEHCAQVHCRFRHQSGRTDRSGRSPNGRLCIHRPPPAHRGAHEGAGAKGAAPSGDRQRRQPDHDADHNHSNHSNQQPHEINDTSGDTDRDRMGRELNSKAVTKSVTPRQYRRPVPPKSTTTTTTTKPTSGSRTTVGGGTSLRRPPPRHHGQHPTRRDHAMAPSPTRRPASALLPAWSSTTSSTRGR